MTVSQLIKKLEEFPKNRQVVFNASGQSREFKFVDSVRIDREGTVYNDDECVSKRHGLTTKLAVALMED